MGEIKLTVTIDRSAAEVFNFTLNPENTPKWVNGVVEEQASESPAKLGTIYRNKDREGNWSEFELTEYQQDAMFVMSRRNDSHHVRYALRQLDDDRCELEYSVWSDTGVTDERFTEGKIQAILQKLKHETERSAI